MRRERVSSSTGASHKPRDRATKHKEHSRSRRGGGNKHTHIRASCSPNPAQNADRPSLRTSSRSRTIPRWTSEGPLTIPAPSQGPLALRLPRSRASQHGRRDVLHDVLAPERPKACPHIDAVPLRRARGAFRHEPHRHHRAVLLRAVRSRAGHHPQARLTCCGPLRIRALVHVFRI